MSNNNVRPNAGTIVLADADATISRLFAPGLGYFEERKDERSKQPFLTDSFGRVAVDAYGVQAGATDDGYILIFTGYNEKVRHAGPKGEVEITERRAYYKYGKPHGYHANEGATLTFTTIEPPKKGSAHAEPITKVGIQVWHAPSEQVRDEIAHLVANDAGIEF